MQFKIARVSAGSVTVGVYYYRGFARSGFLITARIYLIQENKCNVLILNPVIFYYFFIFIYLLLCIIANKTNISCDFAYVPFRRLAHVFSRSAPCFPALDSGCMFSALSAGNFFLLFSRICYQWCVLLRALIRLLRCFRL